MNRIIHFIISIIIWCSFLNLIYAISVIAKDEDELINGFKNTKNKSLKKLVINLNDKTFEFSDDIKIESSVEKLYIEGTSKDHTIIKFNNVTNGIIFTNSLNSSKQEIKFKNISINGYLKFNSIVNMVLEDANINGTMDIDKTIDIDKDNISDEDYENYMNNYLNVTITMKKIIYNGLTDSKYNCINLYGNVIIDESKFYGSPFCENSLIHYDGESFNSINISNSHFDGMFSNNCISMINGNSADIGSSEFENCSGHLDGGGAVRVDGISMSLNNCIFKNIYTPYYGGVFNVMNPKSFDVDGIEVYNSTAIENASLILIQSTSEELANYNVNHVKYYGHKNTKIHNGGDSISSVVGYIHLWMDGFYGEDLYVNNNYGLFTLNIDSSITVRNIEINRVNCEYSNGLLFYNSYSEGLNQQFFEINNGTFVDFYYQETPAQITAIIGTNNKMNLLLSNCVFKNFKVYNSMFLYMSQENNVVMNNVVIDGYHAQVRTSLMESSGIHEAFVLKLNNVILKNFSRIKNLIYGFSIDLTITDSIISNKMECSNMDCDDIYFITTLFDFLSYNTPSYIDIINTTIDTLKGDYGISGYDGATINIVNSLITNCFFTYGAILADLYGFKTITIENTRFINNSGNNGPILNILNNSDDYIINFNNCYFENNHAINFGGIVYSHKYFPETYVSQYNDYYFNDCIFKNNTARKGDVSFSYQRSHEPIFSNIDELMAIDGAFVTNPTSIELTSDSVNSISLYSGEEIPYEIKFRIFDEYNHTINADPIDTINDMILFDLKLNDTYNGKILGYNVYNCDVGYCLIPQIKIVGNPGDYKLIYKIKSFGNYENFDNSYGNIDLKIKECSNSSYLNQDIDNSGFKSCYLPVCSVSCNGGDCVNMNVCDCSNTKFKGLYCNEYYEAEKIGWFNVLLKIISVILTAITLAFMIGIYRSRNDPKIKAASYNFLLIILVGILLNNMYLWISTIKENSIRLCTYEFLFNHLGFSLVYGSIFVKTLRIYIIFEKVNNTLLVKNHIMYAIVLLITTYHIVTVSIWVLSEQINVVPSYTTEVKKYMKCEYPVWKKISILVNLSLLFIDLSLSYANRHVKKYFREHLTIPVYVYVVLTILMEFSNVDYEEKQYIFNSIIMIINTSVILIFIFIKRYYRIFIKNPEESTNGTRVIQSKDLMGSGKSGSTSLLSNAGKTMNGSTTLLNNTIGRSGGNMLLLNKNIQ